MEIPALEAFAVGQTQKRAPFRAMFEFFGVVGLTQQQLHSPTDYSAVLAGPAFQHRAVPYGIPWDGMGPHTDCKHPPAKPYALDCRTRLTRGHTPPTERV